MAGRSNVTWIPSAGDRRVLPKGIPENKQGLYLDMQKAGIAREDAHGRRIDFHALRYTLCTFLHASGCNSRIAMEIMRHSDMKLTADIYTDTQGLPTREAFYNLPFLLKPKDTKTGALIGAFDIVAESPNLSKVTPRKNKNRNQNSLIINQSSLAVMVCPVPSNW